MPAAQSLPNRTKKPSLQLALLSALIVQAYDRRWLSEPVTNRIPKGGPTIERLSRLKARLLGKLEELLQAACRRGRPPRPPKREDEALLLRELLALVPRDAWTYMPRERRLTLVEAQRRLKDERGLTQRRFCELLGISERTFGSWKALAAKSPAPAPPSSGEGGGKDEEKEKEEDEKEEDKKKKKKRKPEPTGRFDLEVTMPDIQVAADTSPWSLFGVPLYIVATQDVGARKQRLWESFAVDTHEDSEVIVDVLEQVLKDKPGTQIVTDQGTPYMSEHTARALEALECEHAPQKEGTPTDKAPLERSFRTVKDALKALSDLTGTVAARIPALRNPDLARPVGRLLLSVFLRVYEAAREVAHPLEGLPAEELAAVAQEQRENARAESRSKRLLLSDIHASYNLEGSVQSFIRAHRHHALEDIQEAERRLRSKACRCIAKACDRYFAGILRNVREEKQRERRRLRHESLRHRRQMRQLAEVRDEQRRREQEMRDRPETALADGLDLVLSQWIDKKRALLADGKGPGSARIGAALDSMRDADPYTVRDRAQAVWRAWQTNDTHSPEQAAAVRRVFERRLAPFIRPPPSTSTVLSGTIGVRPRQPQRPPIRGPHLRI